MRAFTAAWIAALCASPSWASDAALGERVAEVAAHQEAGDRAAAKAALEGIRDALPLSSPSGEDALALADAAERAIGLGLWGTGKALAEAALTSTESTFGPSAREVVPVCVLLTKFSMMGRDLPRAALMMQRAVDVLASTGPADAPRLLRMQGNLAGLLTAGGDLEGAAALYRAIAETEARARGADSKGALDAREGLAQVLRLQGDLDGAVALYEAVDAAHVASGEDRRSDRAALHQAMAALEHGRRDEAARAAHLEVVLSLLDGSGPTTASVWVELSGARLAAGDPAAAVEAARRAVALDEQRYGADHLLAEGSRSALLRSLVAAGLGEEARALAQASARVVEADLEPRLATTSGRERLKLVHQLGMGVIDEVLLAEGAEGGSDLAAYEAVVRWTGLAARAAIADRGAGGPETAALHGRLAALHDELADRSWAGDLDADALAELVAAVETAERELAALGAGAPEASGVASLCAALPADTALVDWVRHREHGPDGRSVVRLAAFVVPPGDCAPRRVNLGDAAPLEEAVARWTAMVARAQPLSTRADRVGAEVRRGLWEPIAEQLEGARRVVLVPDGALRTAPWAALPLADGRYLVEQLGVRVEDSAQDVASAPAEGRGRGALVVGAVDFGGGVDAVASRGSAEGRCVRDTQWGPLPATRDEAAAVARSLRRGAGPVTQLTGRAADEATLREAIEGRRVLHMATHAFVEDPACRQALTAGVQVGPGAARVRLDAPLAWTGLVLSGANDARGSEGLLTAEEVLAHDLRGTELVVLSACETGSGAVAVGEGVIGLRRAFRLAGAGAVVASAWSVDDAATGALMADFYRAWAEGASPTDALASAQRARLLANRARSSDGEPWSWAAFSVSGG